MRSALANMPLMNGVNLIMRFATSRAASEINPVRHFVEISRAVLVKGATLRDIQRPFIVLAVFAATVFSLAVRQHSKRAA